MGFAYYKERNFTEASIGKIPKDWEVIKIEDIAATSSGGTPSRNKKEYYGGDIPWVKSGELKDNVIYDTEEKITKRGLQNSSAKLFSKGTLLVAMYGATVGKTGILAIDATTNQAICAILPKIEFDSNYLRYYIIFKREQLISISSGGAQPNISQEIIKIFKISLPPSIEEQQKIALVLLTVDEAIRKTDEVIAKAERLKKGLMKELLTKGIGHKEFKDTEIGRIPKEWKVVKFEKVGKIRPSKSKFDGEVKNVAFIPMELISEKEVYTDFGIRSFNNVSSYTYCESGDILLAKITPSLENGKQGVVPNEVPHGFALATTEVFPIICKSIDKMFLFYILKLEKFRKPLEYSMRATTGRLRVPKDALLNLKIPIPDSLEEQQKIAHTLLTVDKKLELERNEKVKLEEIKQGLMDLLLTGKIRIMVD